MKCYHKWLKPAPFYRICTACGKTQMEKSVYHPSGSQFGWHDMSFDEWKNSVEEILTPVEKKEDALSWLRAHPELQSCE